MSSDVGCGWQGTAPGLIAAAGVDRPVAVAGLSLGALVAQRLASAARGWPAQYRPDALCLVATSNDLVGTGVDGDLARAIGVPDRLSAAGWKRREL